MVLYGKYQRIGRCYECTFVDSNYDISEVYLSCQGMSMIDYRESIIPVPTVQLHTATAGEQDLNVFANWTCLFNQFTCLYSSTDDWPFN